MDPPDTADRAGNTQHRAGNTQRSIVQRDIVRQLSVTTLRSLAVSMIPTDANFDLILRQMWRHLVV